MLPSAANRKGVWLDGELMIGIDTKRCPKCSLILPLAQFTRCKSGRISSYCKSCMSLYCRHHYVRNAKAHNARRRAARHRYRIRNRNYVVEHLRTHSCVDCGEGDPLVLEFDHIETETKDYAMSDLSRTGRSLEQIKREMAKCEVRCVNCHRRRTARQFGWTKRISLFPGCSSAW
jgi:hypothetical protein